MIRGLIKLAVFKQRARKRATDFSRERKMTFVELMYFMLSMVKASSQNALERFFFDSERGGINDAASV
jgi:hypothetical protein